MIEKTEKYFSENTIEFIEFVEQVKEKSTNVIDSLENNKEADEENLAFLYSCFCSMG